MIDFLSILTFAFGYIGLGVILFFAQLFCIDSIKFYEEASSKKKLEWSKKYDLTLTGVEKEMKKAMRQYKIAGYGFLCLNIIFFVLTVAKIIMIIYY